ncbi:MAG: polyprenyl synthetase family protein [Chloroflexi bacterium]|nr:polyprenyl synthetase family protein [Chloroflexota bacterium]
MKKINQTFLTAIEKELQHQVSRLDETHTVIYHEMLTYHMGWTGEGAGEKARGKRIRPLLVLLAASASGGNWEKALPLAAGIELIHNFSLFHDDIQDKSETRRGRLTAWKIWGVAQAINAGDGMFILANLAMGDLAKSYPAEMVLAGEKIFQETCLNLTRGQHLDIDYEKREMLSVGDYWTMIAGKTATLIATSMQLGALFGNADEETQNAYRDFGHYLGLAFQVQDDILGIWGDEALTGKSTASDLLEGKKSLPVLYGLEKDGEFAKKWKEGPVKEADVREMAQYLEVEGARLKAQRQADQMTDLALKSLQMANPQGEAGDALFSLAERLLGREA